MNNDTNTDEEFFARLGIKPTPKAKGIREVMAENEQRAADAQAFLSRINATAITTSATALSFR